VVYCACHRLLPVPMRDKRRASVGCAGCVIFRDCRLLPLRKVGGTTCTSSSETNQKDAHDPNYRAHPDRERLAGAGV